MTKNLMGKAALPLIYIGVILLAILFIFNLTRYSLLLFAALAIELLGTGCYIYGLKKTCKY
uniref:DUF2892 domain-containing protein n=1 Tax=Prevotella sp. GTC17253 TaxID=3236793 RepID=A0AB33IWT0_9BACT